MLDLVVGTDSKSGGMFIIKCKACGKGTKNVFNRKDRMVARFTATCENKSCKDYNQPLEFRFDGPQWTGLP